MAKFNLKEHIAKNKATFFGSLTEGQFSWMTQDTGQQIGSQDENKIPVYMFDDKGKYYYEKDYDGYGVFGGKDYYELLDQMNGGSGDRSKGIDLAFDKEETSSPILYPALITRPGEFNYRTHDFTQEAKHDPNQSWYDASYEEEDEDEDYGGFGDMDREEDYDYSDEEELEEGFQGQFYAPEYLEQKYGKEMASKITAEIDEMDENSYDRFTDMYSAEEVEDYISDIKDMMNLNKENINESITLDSDKLKSFITAIKKFRGSKDDRYDFQEIAELLLSNKLAKAADAIYLLDTSPNEWIYGVMMKTYPELWDMLFDNENGDYIALAKPKSNLPEGEAAYEYEKGKEAGEKIEKKKMKVSELKAKIKEMVLSEMDGPAVEDEQYDFLKEIEDMLNEAEDYNAQSLFKSFKEEDLIDDRREYDVEDLMSTYPGLSKEEAEKLEDMLQNLNEAEEDEEVDAEATDDVTADADAVVDTEVDVITSEVDPNVKAVQDALTQAQSAAQQLGDPKLTDQIGNTITFFTRSHVVEKPKGAVAENLNESMFPMLKRILK